MEYATIKYKRAGIDKGYTDRLLMVDLGKREVQVKQIDPEFRRMFVGGRGYCLKLVFDGTNAGTKYDSPENVLALSGGPFCGEAGFVGTGKFVGGTISPLTGTFCDSNVGGHFFPIVKLAGFDAIAVTGKTEDRLLVFIDADKEEIRIEDAPKRENSIFHAEELIDLWKGPGEPGNVSFVCTGIGAGHTWFGCLNSVYYDKRRQRCRSKQAGRGGLGTVMRDKGLWGIAVKCNAPISNLNQPADPERLREAGKKLRRVINEVDPKSMSLGTQGTTSLLDMMNTYDLLPVNNYQYGSDEREKNVSGKIFEQQIFKQHCQDGCFAGCNLGCTKGCESFLLTSGPMAGKTVSVDGPEYETAGAVTNLGIFDIQAMLEYAWYCDEYGMDTISAGVTMSFLFEAFERGFLTPDDTGGRELKWGDAAMMLSFLHDMAVGKDEFARASGRGVRYMKGWTARRAAPGLGRNRDDVLAELDRFGMECKGLEFSMYITKESLAQQGGYGFALKGPQHDESWLIAIDQIRNELPSFEDKAQALRWFPLFRTWFNIVGLCKLPWIDVRHPEAKNTEFPAKNMPTIEYYLELVNGTFGTEKTLDDLLEESERSYLLHKLINLRQGFGVREHDLIPLRAMSPVYMNEYVSKKDYYVEYLKREAGTGLDGKSDEERLALLQQIRRDQYDKLIDVVYKEKGYDERGIPLDETLKRLGLDSLEYVQIVMAARERTGERCVV